MTRPKLTDHLAKRFKDLTNLATETYRQIERDEALTREEARDTVLYCVEEDSTWKCSVKHLRPWRIRVFKTHILAIDEAGYRWKGNRLLRYRTS